ncbi:MAG: peptidase and subtilisin kexin sedolisin [Bacteroidetes bacterium]|nr:peptidase and subtilisin kexin sedolisin [Bacteroidota bacterium]
MMRATELALSLIVLINAAWSGHRDTAQQLPGNDDKDVIPGVVVVKFKRSYAFQAGPGLHRLSPLPAAVSELGVTSLARAFPSVIPLDDSAVVRGKIDLSRIHIASIPLGLNPRDVAAKLAWMPQVEYAEPKFFSYPCDVPNDSDYYPWQHVYMDRMSAPAGWSMQKGSSGVVIATVDGGSYWRHPDLLPNVWINPGEDLNHDGKFGQFPPPGGDLNGLDDDRNGFVDDVVGWNFATQGNNPRGFQSVSADHGTATASVSGAVTNNGRGMAGTSWNCRILPVCAADPSGDDNIWYGPEGIEYAFTNGARVINCSWRRGGRDYSQMEQDVITAATQAGALIVAAAGNDGESIDEVPSYPASYQHVLSVGATADTSDELAYFSNYGVNVSVFAPGMRTRVALDNGSYGTMQGTSMSCPLVAGLAGLLAAAHPGWTPDQIAGQIRMTADRMDLSKAGFPGSLGHGRVNFKRALSEAHASIQIVNSSLHTPDGRSFIQSGDTLVLHVVVKNAQSTPARDILFVACSSDPALQPLQYNTTIARLDSGQETSLPDFKFKVGSLSAQHMVVVKLDWIHNGNDTDARTFRIPAYASSGFWHLQASVASWYFYSVDAVDSNVAWAAGGKLPAPYTPLVVRTTNGGTTWTDVTGNFPAPGLGPGGAWNNRLCIAAIDSNRAWVAYGNGRIYATTNGGIAWMEQAYPGQQCGWMNGIWFLDSGHGHALGDGKDQFIVLNTSNGGTSWEHLRNEPARQFSYEYVGDNEFAYTDSDHFWFATDFGRMWRTTDGGNSWSYGTFDGLATSVSFRDNSNGMLGCRDGFLRCSSDGGATWVNQDRPVVCDILVTYAPGSRSAWLISANGIYRTDDDASTWTEQPTDPFVGVPSHVSFADSRTGWFVTHQGEMLRYRLAGISTGAEPSRQHLSDSFRLEQNYPNPFNPSTTIKYKLPRSTNVRLSVFDMLGREVSVLVNGSMDAGVHEVKCDGSRLSSGVYFYRLTTVGFSETKRLMLLK